MSSEFEHDVFISYSSIDKEIADSVCGLLESKGIKCWIAPRNVRPGERYAMEIINGIKSCKAMVLVFTANANTSEHVANEIDRAFNDNKTIIPFLVDETPMNDELRYYLSRKHWFFAYPNYKEKLEALAITIEEYIGTKTTNAFVSAAIHDTETLTPSQMYDIGEDYYCGDNGKEENVDEALKWYKKAAEQGLAEAQLRLGNEYACGDIVTQNTNEAIKWYKMAAEQGNVDAQQVLADMYYNGDGVSQDYIEALKWTKKAAEQGNADAQDDLGNMYENGEGVPQNYNEAFKWYNKAAEQGFDWGQYHLGRLYYLGLGVKTKYTDAAKWFKKAADNGLDDGQLALGLMYEHGNGVSQDYYEAIKWFKKAAEQNNASAQYYLGEFYENGLGVTKNITEALKWYRFANENGNEDALEKIKELKSHLNGYIHF